MSQLKTNSITHVDNTGDENLILSPDGTTTVPGGGKVVGYQQGIWTPVLNNNIVNTQTTYAARWTRIGQEVTLYGRIRWDGTPSAVSIVVSGLPYDPPPNEDGGIYPGPCFCAGFVAGTSGSAVNNIAAYIASGSLSFYWQGSSLDFIQVQYNAFSSTATGSSSPGIIFSVSYQTQDTTWTPINEATVDP
jgi:hypothetical protein